MIALLMVVVLSACSAAVGGEDGPVTTGSVPAPTATTNPETSDGWQRCTRMPTARSEMSAAAAGGVIYIPGGLVRTVRGGWEPVATFEAFDPATDDWSRLADLPSPRHHHMTASWSGFVYVFGGFDADDQPQETAWRYDPSLDRWAEASPLPVPVGAGAAVTVGDLILVVGGQPFGDSVLGYRPADDSWETHPVLGEARHHVAAVARDDLIYVVGGRWESSDLASVEVVSSDGSDWFEAEPLPVARGGHAAAVVNGRIVVAGGEVLGDRRQVLDDVVSLDLTSEAWETGDPLPVALHGLALVAVGGTVYALGGSVVAGDVANDGDCFTISAQSLP